MEHSVFPLELLILIGSTTVVATFFHYLKLPTIIGFILSGIIVGPFGIGLVASVPGAKTLTEVGVVFLMFTIGLEFSFRKLKALRRPFFGLGVPQVLVTTFLAAAVLKFSLDFTWSKSIFLGCLFSLSSTAIVMKLLQDTRETNSPYGGATIGILLAQDLAVIPMMLAMPILLAVQGADVPFSVSVVGNWLLRMAIVGVGLYAFGKFGIPFFLERVTKTKSRELFFFSVLFLCFGVAFAMNYAGLSLAFGAFIAGLMLAESPYGRQATADVIPLRDNFLGLFFASVGMLVDLKLLLLKAHWIFLTVIALIVFKSGLVYICARITKYPASIALITGLLVFQIGEFSFVLADMGAAGGLITQNDLQFFLAVSVVSMMITPFLYTRAPKMVLSQEFSQFNLKDVPKGIMHIISKNVKESTLPPRKLSEKSPPQGAHTVIVGFGIAGQNIAAAMKSLQIPYTVIEQNFSSVQKLQEKNESVFYGDASRHEILEAAGIATAKLAVVAVSGVEMTRAVVIGIREIRPDLQIVVRVQYFRDSEELSDLENVTLVVAEYETTIELLARSLTVYGVSSDEIQNLLASTREKFRDYSTSISDYLRNSVDLPAWEALGSLRPVRIKSLSKAVGKTLEDLQLRSVTGATVVAIFREGLGSAIPAGDFEVQSGDVLQLIGTPEALEKATTYLLAHA